MRKNNRSINFRKTQEKNSCGTPIQIQTTHKTASPRGLGEAALGKRVVRSGFKSLKTVNSTSKTKNIAEGRKCTKTRNWKHYWIKIRVKRKKNNTMDNTSNKTY